MGGKAKILFVDDDPEILATLKRTFRRKYLTETALGPLRGLEVAAEHGPYAVVVADLRMPGLDGLEFFTQLKKLSPETVRIMLTGYASIQTAVSALRLGAVHYLPKPANVADIVKALLEDEPTVEPLETATRMSVRGMEWEYIQRTLAEHGNNIAATARALNMHRRTLQRKLAKRRPPESL